MPPLPSSTAGVSSSTSSTEPPAPTTAGMSSDRAMIAVCEVGPPAAVQSPSANAGSRRAVSDGLRSSATMITGRSGSARLVLDPIGEQPQHAAADVAQVDGAAGEDRILHAGEDVGSLLVGVLPRPPGAMSLADQRPSRVDHLRIFKEFAVRAEDRRLARTGLLPNLFEEVAELALGAFDCMVELAELGCWIARHRFDDDLAALELADRADRHPGEAAMPAIVRPSQSMHGGMSIADPQLFRGRLGFRFGFVLEPAARSASRKR